MHTVYVIFNMLMYMYTYMSVEIVQANWTFCWTCHTSRDSDVNSREMLSVIPSQKTNETLGGLNLCGFCLLASMYSEAISLTDLSPKRPSPGKGRSVCVCRG